MRHAGLPQPSRSKRRIPGGAGYAAMALERDASLAEAHAPLAFVNFYFDWDWAGTETEFRATLACNPAWALGHQ